MVLTRKNGALCAVATLVLALPAFGDAIPYPNWGTINPPQAITAPSTGTFIAYYFDGTIAFHDDLLAVKDVTAGWTSPWFFPNHTTPSGASFTVGNVNAGDTLEFLLQDTFMGLTYSSNPANSPDGINHFYLTPYTSGGPSGIPPGTYVGGEDLPLDISDLNYADVQFVYTIGTPEPVSLALVGFGLVVMGLIRRVRPTR